MQWAISDHQTDPISWMNKNFRGVENQRTISKGRTSSGQRVAIIPIEIPVAQPVPVGSSSQTMDFLQQTVLQTC